MLLQMPVMAKLDMVRQVDRPCYRAHQCCKATFCPEKAANLKQTFAVLRCWWVQGLCTSQHSSHAGCRWQAVKAALASMIYAVQDAAVPASAQTQRIHAVHRGGTTIYIKMDLPACLCCPLWPGCCACR